jgi:hypothetical protein
MHAPWRWRPALPQSGDLVQFDAGFLDDPVHSGDLKDRMSRVLPSCADCRQSGSATVLAALAIHRNQGAATNTSMGNG